MFSSGGHGQLTINVKIHASHPVASHTHAVNAAPTQGTTGCENRPTNTSASMAVILKSGQTITLAENERRAVDLRVSKLVEDR